MRKFTKMPTSIINDHINLEEIDLDTNLVPFKSALITINPQGLTPVDSHRVREIWMILAGSGILTCNAEQIEIGSGDVIYFDSFEKHSVNNMGDDVLKFLSLWWDV